MRSILGALLVGAALAHAGNVAEERPETVKDAVRACLAEAPVLLDSASVLDGPDEEPAVDVVMRNVEEAARRPLEQGPRGYLSAAVDDTHPWEVTGGLGFTLTEGNSDSMQLTAGAEAKREWPKWKLGMRLGILYGETEGVESASEWLFFERLERKLSERATIFQDLLLEHDEQEDLRYRIQFTLGYNRRLVKKETFELWGNVGAGVLHESFFDEDQTEGIGQIGINFTWQITKQLLYEQIVTFYPSLSESGEYRLYWESRFTTPISERLDLRLTIIDRYDSDPQPGVERNDLTVALLIAIKFTQPPPAPAK